MTLDVQNNKQSLHGIVSVLSLSGSGRRSAVGSIISFRRLVTAIN
jgi:hypothetical protein